MRAWGSHLSLSPKSLIPGPPGPGKMLGHLSLRLFGVWDSKYPAVETSKMLLILELRCLLACLWPPLWL